MLEIIGLNRDGTMDFKLFWTLGTRTNANFLIGLILKTISTNTWNAAKSLSPSRQSLLSIWFRRYISKI